MCTINTNWTNTHKAAESYTARRNCSVKGWTVHDCNRYAKESEADLIASVVVGKNLNDIM
eukprot:scaffold121952_cov17-Prasinocladus_malaysianus.AAC.1